LNLGELAGDCGPLGAEVVICQALGLRVGTNRHDDRWSTVLKFARAQHTVHAQRVLNAAHGRSNLRRVTAGSSQSRCFVRQRKQLALEPLAKLLVTLCRLDAYVCGASLRD
jgi:hypothetical protein